MSSHGRGPAKPLSGGVWERAQKLVAEEREACLALVRAMSKIEREVGETWEREARQHAPGSDDQHRRNCEAIGYAHVQFASRLDDLAAAIEARSS